MAALYAYDLMRNTGCQVDPMTNAYCYIEAVANNDPSSYWFYQLPLGKQLGPNITTSACSECTQDLMDAYASALNSTSGANLKGLAQMYNSAADTLNNLCGASYAKATQDSISSSAWANAGVPRTSTLAAMGVLAVVFAKMA